MAGGEETMLELAQRLAQPTLYYDEADVRRLAQAYLEAVGEIRKLRRMGGAPKRPCTNYEAVAAYIAKNPMATIGEVMAAIAPHVGKVGRNTVYYHMRRARAVTMIGKNPWTQNK